MKDYETFDLGDIKLLSGKILKSAKLSLQNLWNFKQKFR